MVVNCLRTVSDSTPRGSALTATMRAYEQATRLVLPARTYTLVRCDGAGFSRYTRNLVKPFDERFAADMDTAALAMVADYPGAHFAYVASDEITVVASDLSGPNTQPHLGGVHPKIVSLTAARATAAFNAARTDLHAETPAADLPIFDSRAFPIADRDDVIRNIWHRMGDTRRNALAMLCDAHLGKPATVGKGTVERIGMLAAAGVLWEDTDPRHAHGRFVLPVVAEAPVTYRRWDTDEPVTAVTRRKGWVVQTAAERTPDGFFDGLLPLPD